MSEIFHLELFLEHLRRVEDSTSAYRVGSLDPAQRRTEVDRAYNAIIESLDALSGYRTLLARDLIAMDAKRRDIAARLEADRADFQDEEDPNPFRPFLKNPFNPFMWLQNIGLFPIRFFGWLFAPRVKRGQDLLERMDQIRSKRRELTEVKKSGDSERARTLSREIEELESALAYVEERKRARTFAYLPELPQVSTVSPKPGAKAAPVAAAAPATTEEIFGRTRQYIDRLRYFNENRGEKSRRIAASEGFLRILPSSTYPEVVFREENRIYRWTLDVVDYLTAEMQICRTLTSTLSAARARMEALFPFVKERPLAEWIHAPDTAQLLAAVREILGLFSTLLGKQISANFQIRTSRLTLPDVSASLVRLSRARRARLEKWQATSGPRSAREILAYARAAEIEARRIRKIGERVALEFSRTDPFLGLVRRALGMVITHVRGPFAVYRQEIEESRFDRQFLTGLPNKLLAWTFGFLFDRVRAIGVAIFTTVRDVFHWIRYFWRKNYARQVRAQTEKILREFAEELENLADGSLVPGEAQADHLLEKEEPPESTTSRVAKPASTGPAAPASPTAALTARVLEALQHYHELYVAHLVFESTFLLHGKETRDLMDALARTGKKIAEGYRGIGAALDNLALPLEADALFYRDALAAFGRSAEDPSTRQIVLSIVRLREGLLAAGHDPGPTPAILGAALEPATRGWFQMKRAPDLVQMESLVSAAACLLGGSGAASGSVGPSCNPATGARVAQAVREIANRNYTDAQIALGTLGTPLHAAGPRA